LSLLRESKQGNADSVRQEEGNSMKTKQMEISVVAVVLPDIRLKRMLLLSLMVCFVANTAQADLIFSDVNYTANSVSFTTTGDLSGYALPTRQDYLSIGFEGDLFLGGISPNISWSNAIFSGASIADNGYSGDWGTWNSPGAWLRYLNPLTSSSQALGSETTLTLGADVLNTSSLTGEIAFYWETNTTAL